MLLAKGNVMKICFSLNMNFSVLLVSFTYPLCTYRRVYMLNTQNDSMLLCMQLSVYDGVHVIVCKARENT